MYFPNICKNLTWSWKVQDIGREWRQFLTVEYVDIFGRYYFLCLSLCFSRKNKVSLSEVNFVTSEVSSVISNPQEASIVYKNSLTYQNGKWKLEKTPSLLSVLGGNLLPVFHWSEHMTLISPLAQRSNDVANVIVLFITTFVMTWRLPSSNWLENKHYSSVLGFVKLGYVLFQKECAGRSMAFGGSQSKWRIFQMLL